MLLHSRRVLRYLILSQERLGVTSAPRRCLATPAPKWFTETEKENAKILEAASAKVTLFNAAQEVRMLQSKLIEAKR